MTHLNKSTDQRADLVAAAQLVFNRQAYHVDKALPLEAPDPGAVSDIVQSEVQARSLPTILEAVDKTSSPESGIDVGADSPVDLTGRFGPVIVVEPADCHPFPGAARAGISPDDASNIDLRDSIRAHGVLEPIVLFEYRGQRCILAGNRRHAIVTQLRADGVHVALPARTAAFTDIEAVAFAYVQNVGRIEPSAMEQALSVRWTLETVDASQAVVAEAMGMSPNKVSRLLLLASLPEWVLAIVTDPGALSENFAGVLQKSIGEPKTARELEKRAGALKRKNETLPGPAAARYLLTGKLEPEAINLIDRGGVRHATIKANSRGGLTLRVSPSYRGEGTDLEAIYDLIATRLLAVMRENAASPRR